LLLITAKRTYNLAKKPATGGIQAIENKNYSLKYVCSILNTFTATKQILF
jgi:hypothetical protein